MKGVVVPVRDLVGCVTGLASCALAPRPVRGLMDAGALAWTPHTLPLPVCGLGSPGLGLWTATRPVGFAHALGMTVRGLDKYACALLAVTDSWRDCSWSHGSRYRSRDRYQSRDRSLYSSDGSRSRDRSWRPRRSCWDHMEAVAASWDHGNSGSRAESAPAVVGSSYPRPMPSLQDLARLFPSLSESHAHWDVVVGSTFLAAAISG